MESKYTKGNWEVKNLVIKSTLNNEIFRICSLHESDVPSSEEAEANAKLISCAPDMAKMLSDEIKLLDRFMKMLPGKGIMWHEMKERKKFIKIVLDKATL